MAPRRVWLDWQRGIAVLFMIEVHILTGWTTPADMRGSVFHLLHLLGGLAAPGFLYMAGLSVALADDAYSQRGLAPNARRNELLRRALYVLGVAYTFRVVEYILGGAFWVAGGWRGILRVDILNVIGVTLVACALITQLGARAGRYVALVLGLLIVVLTPLVAAWPTSYRVTDYLYPTVGTGFSVFPWAAFALLGFVVGTLVTRGLRAGRLLLGAAVVAWLAFALTKFELPYGAWNYWHTSPAWFLWRLALTMALSGGLMLVSSRWKLEPLALLGRHSLMVYMVSVELTYGLSTRVLHGALTLTQSLVGIVVMTLACAGLCWWVERRKAQGAARTGQRSLPNESQVVPGGTGT